MKKKIAAIAVFLAVLILPTVMWPLFNAVDKTEINENRSLESFPSEFNNGFFTQFDKFYADRLPLRKAMIKLYSDIGYEFAEAYKKILSGLNIDNYYYSKNGAVLGENDWLFYERDNSLDYYKGVNIPSLEELREMVRKAETVNDYFKSLGKEFVIFVAPNKEQIYAEYMPSCIKVESDEKRLDVISEFFENNSSVRFVYPKDALMNAKESFQLYFKRDTHWDRTGAYIGFCELMKALDLPFDSAKFGAIERTGGDLAGMILKTDVADVMHHPVYKPQYALSEEPPSYNSIAYFQSTNPNNKNLVLFGDSFRENMEFFICKEFTNSLIAHRSELNLNNKFENEFASADVVVFMSVERYDVDLYGDGGILDRFIQLYGLDN